MTPEEVQFLQAQVAQTHWQAVKDLVIDRHKWVKDNEAKAGELEAAHRAKHGPRWVEAQAKGIAATARMYDEAFADHVADVQPTRDDPDARERALMTGTPQHGKAINVYGVDPPQRRARHEEVGAIADENLPRSIGEAIRAQQRRRRRARGELV